MSRIQPIATSFVQQKNAKVDKTSDNCSKNSFGSDPFKNVAALNPKQKNLVETALMKVQMGRFGTALNKLSETTGEIQNILFIGFGTAFIAPLFIAFNPISHQDKESKEYSAWRQPLSAVIATGFGLGINYPIACAFNNIAAKGTLPLFDMSALPPSDYVKNRYKRILKNFDKIYGKTDLKGANKEDKEFLDMVNTKGTIKSVEDFKHEFVNFKAFESAVHGATSTIAAEKLLDKENPKGIFNVKFKDFLIDKLKFEADTIDSNRLNPDIARSRINDLKATEALELLGFDPEIYNEQNLRTFINNDFYREAFDELSASDKKLAKGMFDSFKEIADKNDVNIDSVQELERMFTENISKHGFDSMQRKTITRLAETVMSRFKSENDAGGISFKTLTKVINVIKSDNKGRKLEHILIDGDELLNKPLSDILVILKDAMNIDDAINSVKKPDYHVKKINHATDEEFLKVSAKFLAKNIAKEAQIKFKGYSKVQGILLSIATLPFSCGLLNYVYPKFMNKFFPELSNKKAQKGGK